MIQQEPRLLSSSIEILYVTTRKESNQTLTRTRNQCQKVAISLDYLRLRKLLNEKRMKHKKGEEEKTSTKNKQTHTCRDDDDAYVEILPFRY